MANPRVKLLHEWEYSKRRYRLLARADYSPGYEDMYLIEQLGEDGYGEPRWDLYTQWHSKTGGADGATKNMLVQVIKELLHKSTGEL